MASADNPADPYIVAQAKALNNDPNQIFAFLRDQIGFEVYRGSLRGARGTLWSKAGNSLDRASLLVALLGASGVSSRYVEGTIPVALEQQLILSMFPNVYQVTGCPPPGALRADPANDPGLLSNVSDHFWVEFGPGFTPADPSFPNAQIGSVQGAATNRFTTIPAALQHTVTFRLDIEEYVPAAALFGAGDGIFTTEVLNQTFATTDLVGMPVSAANFVNQASAGSVISASTFTYSPYLRLGSDPTTPSADTVIRGQDYQETFTNFPLGNQALTGVFLRIDVSDPGSSLQTYERPMLDRIGYAARQGGVAVNLSFPSPPAPALTPLDMISVNVLSSLQDPAQLALYATAQNTLDAVIASQTAQSANQQLIQAETDKAASFGRAETAFFASKSDILTSDLANKYWVRAYESSPRLLLFKTSVSPPDAGRNSTLSFAIDLRQDNINVVAPPQQVSNAPALFNVGRGIAESVLESSLASALASSMTGGVTVTQSTAAIFAAANAQNIPVVAISTQNLILLNSLSLSADAKARITTAVQAGKVVVTPEQAVPPNATPAIGWYEFDSNTGDTVGVLEDGGHQGITEFVNVVLVNFAHLINLATQGKKFPTWMNLTQAQKDILQSILGSAALGILLAALGALLAFGFGALALGVVLILIGVILLAYALNVLATLLSAQSVNAKALARLEGLRSLAVPGGANVIPPIVFNLGPSQKLIPGTPTGVVLTVVPDPLFTVPLNSSPGSPQLPLAFKGNVQNTGAAAGLFNLTVPGVPSGFTAETSLPSLIVPGEQTGRRRSVSFHPAVRCQRLVQMSLLA